jgi:hypothetical protein
MNEERRRILQLVADGRITAEEAADLLDALGPETRGDAAAGDSPSASSPGAPPPSRRAHALVIQVQERGEKRVNLRIPIGLARAAGRFIPRNAQHRLREHGIDLEELISDLSGSEHGTLLQVEDDEDRVLIAVE